MINISDLFNIEKGSLQSSKNDPGEYNFLTASEDWKTHSSYTHDCEALIFAMAASGSLGRTHYIKGKFIASDLCFILTPSNKYKNTDLKFYKIIFDSLREDIVKNTATGTSKLAINKENFGKYKFPYFTPDKQKIFSKKFEELKVKKGILNTHMMNQENYISLLRQAILQEAVQGKLVPQDPNDEPASELLKKFKAEKEKLIKEGKIKKEKNLFQLSEIKKPFDLPENWEWCSVNNLLGVQSGYAFKSDWYTSTGIKLVRNINVSHNKLDWSDTAFIPLEKRDDFKEFELAENDILISLDRPIISTGLKLVRINKNDLPSLLVQRVGRIFFYSSAINIDYVYLWFNSPLFIEAINPGRSNGIPHISQKDVEKLPFPLPPFNEQIRIVEKVNKLMKLCDESEEKIKESQKNADLLMQAVLQEAFKN